MVGEVSGVRVGIIGGWSHGFSGGGAQTTSMVRYPGGPSLPPADARPPLWMTGAF